MRCRDLYQQGREYAVVVDAKEADTARGELEHYEALAYPAEPVSAEDRVGFSPEIEGGRLDMSGVLKPIYEQERDTLGKKFEYPTD